MPAATGDALSRRQFLQATLTAGGGLLIGAALPLPGRAQAGGKLHAFVTVEPHGGTVIGVS